MFYGTEFVFDEVPSEVYELMLVNFTKGKISDSISNGYEIEEEKVRRKVKPLFLNAELKDKLSFELTFARETEIDRYDKGAMYKWLFDNKYKKLKIIQDDLIDVVFNCILTKPKQVSIYGAAYAITVEVVCDGAFASSNENVVLKTISSGVSTQSIYVPSCSNEYVYPYMSLAIVGTESCNLEIKNLTDSSTRTLTFEDLNADQNLTVDNNFGIIESTGSAKLSNITSKKWLRLLPGDNELEYNLTTTAGETPVLADIDVELSYSYPISV